MDSKPEYVTSHSLFLLSGLNDLRKRSILCDVEIRDRTGKNKISAHKNVLASCSPYFEGLFTTALCSDDTRNYIECEDIPIYTVEILVNFAYCGVIDITEKNVEELLFAASLYQMSEVLQLCCEFLTTQLHPSNCLGIASYTDMHSCHSTHSKAMDFCAQYFDDVVCEEEFCQLSFEKVYNYLSLKDLNCKSEMSVVNAINKWIDYKPKIRRNKIEKLIQCVQLNSLSLHQLENTLKLKYISSSETCVNKISESINNKKEWNLRIKCSQFSQNNLRRPLCKKLLAVGGKYGPFSTLSRTELFEDYNWKSFIPMLTERFECAAVMLNRCVYAIGGIICQERPSISLLSHDESVDCWDLDNKIQRDTHKMIHQRSALAAVALNGLIFCIGGYDGEEYLRSVEYYTPRINKWAEASPMQESRSCHAACHLDSHIYVAGGLGPPCLDSVERYDMETDEWVRMPSMNKKRITFGLSSLCGCLYAVGGYDGVAYLSSMERFDPFTEQWTMVTGMGGPRTGMGIAVLGARLYVAGGHSGSIYLNSVQSYDPFDDKWTEESEMVSKRCSFALIAIP